MLDAQEMYALADSSFVCQGCVTDTYLASLLSASVQSSPCSFCKSLQAADIRVLLDAIKRVILADYNYPAAELPYDGQEGGYQGQVWDGYSIVADELEQWTDNEELLHEVASAFSTTEWAVRDYASLRPFDALRYGWASFSEVVTYRMRFVFLMATDEEDPGEIAPGRMLSQLGELFTKYALFATLPTGLELVRARIVKLGERPSTAEELGTAPPNCATSPNRMSPAGIPMFYAAMDEETAVLETFHPDSSKTREIALARFRNTRDLNVLDLTRLPKIPSQFDWKSRADRDAIRFLHSFVHDFCRPVQRDERAHAEYAPTQIVTEFVRYQIQHSGKRIDGIRYPSSRSTGEAVVIFADPAHCGPRDPAYPRNSIFTEPTPFLQLESVRYIPCPQA